MAITKIHAIQATVHKAVNYICNPQKTDESILISSFGCSPETAAFDFKFALSKTNQADPNKAFHLIQAFAPGEVSYKEAHQIGVELANKLLEGKFSYIVSTHIDKGHVHNHIIFCAADNVNHEKYHDCKQTYYHIRRLNDELCSKHQLSVISPTNQRGKSYKEWTSGRNGTSWKIKLKQDIDEAIQNADTYEQCMELIRAKGYEIKGETIGGNALKYISFRPLDREHFVRGSLKSLGAEYTKERIKERVETKALAQTQKRVPFPARKKPLIKDYSSRTLIDTSEEKFTQSPGLQHWAAIDVHKAVNYICNPQKTDESILISSFGCSPETAAFDFKFALSKTNQADPNKAFHLIQAFAPGEVSYKEAHQIGVELANKLLEGKFSYIVSTHIDKGHVHNHIIFCAADNVNHEKYHDCKQTYYHIRRLNDELCSKHQLSVISPTNQRGKSYKEWTSGRNGTSWKIKLKQDIDEAIQNADTYEQCMELIRAKGYEIKGETIGGNALKYISFRPLDREHFVRGSLKSLGAEYTKERIKERVETKALAQTQKRVPFPARKKPLIKDYSSRTLIDTSEEKFTQSPGLQHWAAIENLKIAASSYSKAGSIIELEKQIESKSVLAKTARNSLVETERQLKDLGQILKYAEQYQSNHIYHIRYRKSKDPDAYLRHHETELLLHDGAENMLKRFGISLKHFDIDKFRNDYNALYAKKEALQKTYKSAEKDIQALNRKLDNLNQYLDRTPGQEQTTNHKPEKDFTTL